MYNPAASQSEDATMRTRDAVKYGRVSSKEQEKEGFSIPAQWKLLDQYAKAEGFRVVREFVDVETAKKPGRAGFDEMVNSSSARRLFAYC
jgi:DNA invertase Pin-like site-specific DNA recombinase